MQQTQVQESKAHPGLTGRKDTWWVEPALVAVGFTLFIIYATCRGVFEPNFYDSAHAAPGIPGVETLPYLSPYSPKIALSFWQWSPAILILWVPAGFRATCYYYRKAYYRAYFMDPPACAVGHFGGNKYCGETSFPFVLQNLHRYFFYAATIVLAVLWIDVFDAFFRFADGFHVTLVNLIMLANVVLLTNYSAGCHAFRHLIGGKLDCFSCSGESKARFKIWNFVTKLNEHHMLWAWLSLFSVGFTDFIIREVYTGAIHDIRFF